MSWIDTLSNLTKNVGRGALDVFSLGGNELGHKFGGQGYKNVMSPLETGMGANFEAGAAGGSGMMGAQGLGAFGGSGAGAGMSAPNMGMAGSSTMPGGMSSPLSLYGGNAGAVGGGTSPSTISQVLNMMRMMPQGGGQQAPASQQANVISRLYQMFPDLKPGAKMGGM